jgi:CRP-like cAMP-binding protein
MSAIELPSSNHLLSNLPSGEYQQILEASETIELKFGDILCEPYERFRFVYFPLSGFISLMASVEDQQPLEMGLIGNEGLLGVTLILEVDTAVTRGIVHGNGSVLKIGTSQFKQLLKTTPVLLSRLKCYLFVIVTQFTQSASCNHFHKIESRLALWLLMSHDRTHTDHFHFTHDFLASILGVRRSSISIAANKLQRMELISYARGEIKVLNRSGLEAASCSCYAAMSNSYNRLLGSINNS